MERSVSWAVDNEIVDDNKGMAQTQPSLCFKTIHLTLEIKGSAVHKIALLG